MTSIEAVVLGVVQGVTEFLPISSTAHLRIVPEALGWSDPGAAFTAVLQLGTLAAVLLFFAKDLLAMLKGTVAALTNPARRRDPEARLLVSLIIGTVPVVIAGVLFKKAITGEWRALTVIASAMIVVAIGLAVVERVAKHERTFDQITLRDALIIGAAQALALVPGVSRSGITLLAAMAIGLRRDAAARFSFLLSIPAIAGAGVFEMKHVLHAHESKTPLLIGTAVAAVTGYASIAWLLKFLRTRTTMPFVVYRILVGALILALVLSGTWRNGV
ncbi:MAG TPA: undecaprenyl-diphosphatase UppP [Polyangia bacterium]|nr:undecaprenyl-diphosphatase UppP [Polyangia bacterium]